MTKIRIEVGSRVSLVIFIRAEWEINGTDEQLVKVIYEKYEIGGIESDK